MTDHSESKLWTRSALLTQLLPDSDLHIWCASLNVSLQDLSHYFSLLSQDEISRAERFYFERDRNHFIAGRGLLRYFLGSYLDLEPARIEFDYGAHGKPAVKSELDKNILEFNLSHSKDLALYAFNWNRRVGIDVEYMIAMADINDFAEKFFTPRESEYIDSLSGKQKDYAFFKTWTCKEAFFKANGSGLTVPINQVEIFLDTNGAAALTSIGNDKEQNSHWRLELLNPIPGYQAALAIEGTEGQIVFRKLNDRPAT